jgi:hypothetical protein
LFPIVDLRRKRLTAVFMRWLALFWRNAERSRALLPIMVSICLACTGSAMLMTAVSLYLGKPGIAPDVLSRSC